MNRDEIKKLLPHREPMLLLDETTPEGDEARGRYTVRGDEWFVQGHFPGNPVVPGVVLCEMIGQNCAVLIGDKLLGKTPFFTGMNKVKFRHTVRPGDTVELMARIYGLGRAEARTKALELLERLSLEEVTKSKAKTLLLLNISIIATLISRSDAQAMAIILSPLHI